MQKVVGSNPISRSPQIPAVDRGIDDPGWRGIGVRRWLPLRRRSVPIGAHWSGLRRSLVARYCAGDVAGERGDRASGYRGLQRRRRRGAPGGSRPGGRVGSGRLPVEPATGYRGHDGMSAVVGRRRRDLRGVRRSRSRSSIDVGRHVVVALDAVARGARQRCRGRVPSSRCVCDRSATARSSRIGASKTEPKPSKPPGCRSRRCRRRTWRSCGAAIDAFNRRDLRRLAGRVSTPRSSSTAAYEAASSGEPIAATRGRELLRSWLEDVRGRSRSRSQEFVDVGDRVVIVGIAPSRARGRAAASTIELHVAAAGRSATARSSRSRRFREPRPKPSKPPGCGSRRCRRRTWRSCERLRAVRPRRFRRGSTTCRPPTSSSSTAAMMPDAGHLRGGEAASAVHGMGRGL